MAPLNVLLANFSFQLLSDILVANCVILFLLGRAAISKSVE